MVDDRVGERRRKGRRATIKDSVAKIGLDKWTSRDRGEKLREK